MNPSSHLLDDLEPLDDICSENGDDDNSKDVEYQSNQTHGDLRADVVLESTEGHEFYVHSYALKTYSQLFRDLGELPRSDIKLVEGKTHVPLPASSDTLHDLIAFMFDRHPTPRLDPPYEELFTLCDYMQCDVILLDRILQVLQLNMFFVPWQTFILASKFNNPNLASQALNIMRNAPEPWARNLSIHTFPEEEASKLPLKYLLALLRAIVAARDSLLQGPSARDVNNPEYFWPQVASSFDHTCHSSR